jgi:hypothetical protein
MAAKMLYQSSDRRVAAFTFLAIIVIIIISIPSQTLSFLTATSLLVSGCCAFEVSTTT